MQSIDSDYGITFRFSLHQIKMHRICLFKIFSLLRDFKALKIQIYKQTLYLRENLKLMNKTDEFSFQMANLNL